MKKKVIALVLVICFLLTACGSKLPKFVTQEVYDVCVDALDIMDKYNKGSVSKDDAEERIKRLEEKLKGIEEELEGPEEATCFSLRADILKFKTALTTKNGDTYAAAKELREDLKLD